MRKRMMCLVAATAMVSACAVYDPPMATRLTSPLNSDALKQVSAAIARGEKTIDVGDPSRPFEFDSGGNAQAARDIVVMMQLHGVGARCVGFCGSALAEIVLNAPRCEVTPNGNVKPHLAFVPGGTAAQNREAAQASIEWWTRQNASSPARMTLVRNLSTSPNGSWLMRTDELRSFGCKI